MNASALIGQTLYDALLLDHMFDVVTARLKQDGIEREPDLAELHYLAKRAFQTTVITGASYSPKKKRCQLAVRYLEREDRASDTFHLPATVFRNGRNDR